MPLILKEKNGSLFTITLNRPEKYNSFTEPMALELQKALEEAGDSSIRCVVLKANGKAFCAGQDLPEVLQRAENPEYSLTDTVETSYNPIVLAIRNLEKPVICAVQGTAAGAGANMAIACDIVVASVEARFVQAFSNIGLIPDSGGTWFMPRLIGMAKTNALYLLDEHLSAHQAAEAGLIYKAVEHDTLETEILAIAEKLAALPTKGFALYKQAVNQSFGNSLQQHLSLEAALQGQAGSTEDYREGVTAFTEKRNPQFKGI